MVADENLDRRIKAQPQELQDEILEYTLPIELSVVTVNLAHYKPPWQLSFSRATRNKVPEHFYATSTFHLMDSQRMSGTLAQEWLRPLGAEHRLMIANIHADNLSGGMEEERHPNNIHIEAIERQVASGLSQIVQSAFLDPWHIKLQAGALKTNYQVLEVGAGGLCVSAWRWSA